MRDTKLILLAVLVVLSAPLYATYRLAQTGASTQASGLQKTGPGLVGGGRQPLAQPSDDDAAGF